MAELEKLDILAARINEAHRKALCNFLCARRTSFSHTAGALYFRGLRSFALPLAEKNGGAPTPRSPCPLLGGIKAQPLREEIVHLG
jgi:hypothetical protein